MKRWNNYTEIIGNADSYTTKTNYKPAFPTLRFYLNLAHVIYYSNRMAVKGEYDDIQWPNSSLEILHGLEKSGVEIHIEGMKNFQSFNTAAIFIANHMSSIETLVLPGIIHPVKSVCFIMKEELVDYPIFGPVTGARDPILVGRSNPREDLMKAIADGAERVARGKSIVVFPQKTRSSRIDAASFNTLGIKIAKKNNVPVIPVAIVTDALSNGKIVKDYGKIDPSKKVYFSFGEPIYIKGNGTEEHEQCIEYIKNKFISWGREDLIEG